MIGSSEFFYFSKQGVYRLILPWTYAVGLYQLCSFSNARISSFSRATICSCGSFSIISPFLMSKPSLRPPAIAISACFASPGPFTAQPIIATFTSQFMVCRKASISFTTGCISHAVLPQVGQAIKFGVFFNKPQHFNSCLTIVISFTGSPLTLMRIVSPIPLFN